jgi:hypothetical protein
MGDEDGREVGPALDAAPARAAAEGEGVKSR